MRESVVRQNGWRAHAALYIISILAVFAAHEVGARPTVGLVLSGGGARGGAHVGVIRWKR